MKNGYRQYCLCSTVYRRVGCNIISGGAMMYMIVGDALVALAGLSFVKFSDS